MGIVFYGNSQESLTMMQAIEKALKNNFDVRLVEGNYSISKKQNTWGNAGMSPTFSLNIGNTATLQDNSNNPASFIPGVVFSDNLQPSLNMNWTIFSGFGIRITKAQFEQLEAQTKGNVIIVIENTIYDVILAYYTAVVQEQKLKVLEDLLNYSKEKLNYYKLKNQFGINTSFDLLEFENQVYTDSSNYLLQELALKNAKRNLNLIMAEGIDLNYQLIDSLEANFNNPDFEDIKQQMVGNNQNLKNQYINYQLQEINLNAKKSAYYPVVSLSLGVAPSVGYFRLFGDEGFSSSTNTMSYTGAINLKYDIFQGWNRKRNSEIATIQLDMAALEIEQMTLSLSHQLKGFHDLYNARTAVEKMAQLRMDNANRLWELGKDKYDLGLINIFNLNDIKLSYEQAVLSYYDRLFELLESHYDLMRISGGISQEFNIPGNID